MDDKYDTNLAKGFVEEDGTWDAHIGDASTGSEKTNPGSLSPFTPMLHRVYSHEAFQALDPYERAFYNEVQQRIRFPGRDRDGNNGQIRGSIIEISAGAGMDRHTGGKCAATLTSSGFLELMEPSKRETYASPSASALWRVACFPCAVTGRPARFNFKMPKRTSRSRPKRRE